MALDYSTPIDAVDNISFEEFQENYMIPQKPLKIRNLLRHTRANQTWSVKMFKEKLGDIEVGVFNSDNEYLDRSFKTPPETMKFGDYLDLITTQPTDKRIFLFNIFKHLPELKNDFEFPTIAKNFIKQLPFTFFGGKDSVVRIHQDMDWSNVYLTQFHGRKKVILFPPSNSDLLYRYPFSTHSAVDVENPDYDRFPALAHVRGMETTLEEGETLFMPSGYWHHIKYLDGGFAMSMRSMNPKMSVRLYGLWKVTGISTTDDLMRKSFGKKWFGMKEKWADENAERAMKKAMTLA